VRRRHRRSAGSRRFQEHLGLPFPLVEANAENVTVPDDSSDPVSASTACVWCDPQRCVAEAARLPRLGGLLVFLTNSVQVTVCVREDGGHSVDSLLRPQKGMSRMRWPGGGIEFHPSHGDWIRVLREKGFVVEALHELYGPDDATTDDYHDIAPARWARRRPVEDLWSAELTR
jgi:SAM-dependent methyltransferase